MQATMPKRGEGNERRRRGGGGRRRGGGDRMKVKWVRSASPRGKRDGWKTGYDRTRPPSAPPTLHLRSFGFSFLGLPLLRQRRRLLDLFAFVRSSETSKLFAARAAGTARATASVGGRTAATASAAPALVPSHFLSMRPFLLSLSLLIIEGRRREG